VVCFSLEGYRRKQFKTATNELGGIWLFMLCVPLGIEGWFCYKPKQLG
jgi:hypothetical protein